MRYPVAMVLLIPILFLNFFLLGDNWGYGFVPMFILAFLLEIRLKKGEVTRKSIKEFFNTPLNPRGETEAQMLDRHNLKYKFSPIGLLLCLAWLFVAPYFGIKLYSEYKDWSFPIEIDTILGVTYLMVLGILYRVFFVKTKTDEYGSDQRN